MKKEKHIKVHPEDHSTIKLLAVKAGKTMMDFMKDLIASYRKGAK